MQMAIYKLSDFQELPLNDEQKEDSDPSPLSFRERIFSSLAARLFFALLLCADLAWTAYSLVMLLVYFLLSAATGFSSSLLKQKLKRTRLSIKRALVSFVALTVAIFSPALGILFACSYFLMYDKEGIDEVVPASLKDQFKEFSL
ncbi:MAG: hypothetical protein WDZ28_01375 [Simkaniaceae bacterium]